MTTKKDKLCPDCGKLIWNCSNRCGRCSQRFKGNTLLYSEIKLRFERKGCKLIFKKYINRNAKLNFICSCGKKCSISLSNLKKYKCNGRHIEKFCIEDVRKYFFRLGYILLSKNYKNVDTRLEYICPKGHKWSTSFHNFKHGYRCKECGVEKQRLSMLNREFSKEHCDNMKKSHWANRPDYKPENHPRYGTKYPCSWSKGLTKFTDKRLKLSAIKMSKSKRDKTYEDYFGENANYMKKLRKKQFVDLYKDKNYRKKFMLIMKKAKNGTHKYLYRGIKYRSRWEVMFAKILTKINLKFYYELKFFDLGKYMYQPDFYIPSLELWVEIKGYSYGNSEFKMRIFSKKYNLIILRSKSEILEFESLIVS